MFRATPLATTECKAALTRTRRTCLRTYVRTYVRTYRQQGTQPASGFPSQGGRKRGNKRNNKPEQPTKHPALAPHSSINVNAEMKKRASRYACSTTLCHATTRHFDRVNNTRFYEGLRGWWRRGDSSVPYPVSLVTHHHLSPTALLPLYARSRTHEARRKSVFPFRVPTETGRCCCRCKMKQSPFPPRRQGRPRSPSLRRPSRRRISPLGRPQWPPGQSPSRRRTPRPRSPRPAPLLPAPLRFQRFLPETVLSG